MARGSGKSKSKTHIKVKRKDKILKRDIEKPKEEKEPDDMVDAEGFICLPPAQDLPEELEQELEAFRAKKVIFADQIQEQLKETQTFDPTVKKVYTEIGKLLRYYRSGKIPKAFKLVPRLERWEDVLDLAKPEDWSPCAMYQATKIFISSMNPKQAQRFLVRWLTPAIRKNIHDYKKLNYHYYQALKKATYKPAAWFKGILLPICYDGNCTLKEAQILGSIITNVSLPMPHTSAALLKIAEMEYSGSNSYFIKIILQKKYSLPSRVIQGLCDHFSRFTIDERQLPVLWHQSLLTFVQLYGREIPHAERENLALLTQNHVHPGITPVVRKHLFESSK